MCAEVFQDRATVSFILTNSRSFSPDRTCAVHQEIAENIAWAAGETEFARDPAFGYASLSLTAWCQEKMGGACRAEDCICVALEDLRALRTEKILQQLTAVENFAKVIVNAACYEDLKVFCAACCEALDTGKTFLLRTAASWVKVFGGIPGKALLRRGITAVIYTTRERVTPPGVPVWLTGPESKFPELPYVILPGNVGEEGTLTLVVRTLMGTEGGSRCRKGD